MVKLIKSASDRWRAKEIPWEEPEALQAVTKETSHILCRCLCGPKDYGGCVVNPGQRREYGSAYDDVGKEGSRVQAFLHGMGFAPDGKGKDNENSRQQPEPCRVWD